MVSLNINSQPQNARVFIDGVDTFQITPSTFDILSGLHTYLIRLEGYQDVIGTVDILDGQNYLLNAVMQSNSSMMQQDFNKAIINLGYAGLAVSVIALIVSRAKSSK